MKIYDIVDNKVTETIVSPKDCSHGVGRWTRVYGECDLCGAMIDNMEGVYEQLLAVRAESWV